ncbi:MAG TPA: carboxypeptidase-like regulatory domain-containing protein [Polyangia bacterium]
MVPRPPHDALAKPQTVAPDTTTNLAGIVQDRRGTPLPDVLIIAWPKGKRGDIVGQARSGDDGRFMLPGLRPDRWMLLVEAGGLGTLETERQVPEDGPAVLMLDGESRTLTGVVTDSAGRREPGARVSLGSPGLRWTRVAESDANGIFEIGGLGNGRFTVRAMAGKQVSAATVVVIDEALTPVPHVRLSLQNGVYVEGRVLDDTGRALVGAMVDVMAMPSDDLPISGQAGREGRYRLGPVAPGKYQVLARLEDHVLLDAPEPRLGAREKESFDLRLARAARVVGRVVDESSRPMVGVQVDAISLIGGHDDLVVIPGALPLAAEAAELPVGRLLRPGGLRSSPTDKAGRFFISGLSPGRTRIEILHPAKLPLRHEPLLLAPGDERDVGDLTMQAGATLAGRVLDDSGRIAEGAIVEARIAGKPKQPAVRATTDKNGEFSLRVPMGDYALVARTGTLDSGTPLSIHVQTDVPADSCVLRLAPRLPKASGR